MKKRILLKTMLLLCALIVGSSSVWAISGTLISGLEDIISGDTLYIAALNDSKYYMVPNTTINGQTFTCNEGFDGAGEFVFTAVSDVPDAYYIYNTNLAKYLVATASNTFGYVDNTSSDYGYWTFSPVSSGGLSEGFSGVFSVQHGKTTQYLRAYSNTVKCYNVALDQGIYLFKKVTPATLPFSWEGSGTAGSEDLGAVTGVVGYYLGWDYDASNAPYRLKFDDVNRNVTIYTDEAPVAVSFTAKLFDAASTGSKIKVQGSADGLTFTDIQEFTIKGAANATFKFTTTNAFNVSYRAVKLIMSSKDQNVGVGSILITNGNVPVTITSAGWASFSHANALDFEGTGVTAYIAKAKDDTHVTLTEIEKVPAETGIVVHASAAGNYAIPVLSVDPDDADGNLLKPWLTAGTPTDATYYILSVDGDKNPIFKKSKGGTLAAGKSYLVMPASGDAPQLSVDFGEGTTNLEAIRTQMEEAREGIFDLSGRRVVNPTKGIYIVNGKKIYVK